MTKIAIMAAALVMVSLAVAQGPKRNRGEGIYQAAGSNTTGTGNAWVTLRAIGFIWANKALDTTRANASQKPGYFPFGEVSSEIGLLNYASLLFDSRLLSYTRNHWFQFGAIDAGVKLTLPDNKELRRHGVGLEVKYIWNSPGDTFPSVAGFRVGTTGFAPEGYIASGSILQVKCLYDLDVLTVYSWLPLKISCNAGMRLPLKTGTYVTQQFLLDAGVAYAGLGFDVFAEYSLEAFNNFLGPKTFRGLDKVMEVHFRENPMYVSLGGRIRYDNGVTVFACVPFLVSANVGSAMTNADKVLLNQSTDPGSKYYDENKRGLTDPFDPWFAKWKLVGEISIPVFYRQTGSEMMRNFLLLKNRKEGKKIDIDQRLKQVESRGDSLQNDRSDAQRRLEEIRKRREQIDKQE